MNTTPLPPEVRRRLCNAVIFFEDLAALTAKNTAPPEASTKDKLAALIASEQFNAATTIWRAVTGDTWTD